MTIDELLIQLKQADTPANQAALVAESVLSDLPSDVAAVARRCAFLPWFNNDLIRALWLDQQAKSDLEQTIALIIDLPFVEPIPWGYKYHDLTREGLLSLYQENNSNEIIQACQAVTPALLQDWEDDQAALAALYCLAMTNQHDEAINKLNELLLRLLQKGNPAALLPVFTTLTEAESFSFVGQIPLQAAHWQIKGFAHFARANLQQAVSAHTKAIQLDPRLDIAFTSRGIVYTQMEKTAEALADFTEAIRLNPENELAFFNRGETYAKMEKTVEGLADFTEAIRLKPNKADAFFNRGKIYAKMEKWVEAVADFTEAIRLNPDNTKVFEIRGIVFYKMGKFGEALADLNETIRRDPENADAFYFRGRLYAEKEEGGKALADLTKAFRMNPKFPLRYKKVFLLYLKIEKWWETLTSYMKNANHTLRRYCNRIIKRK